MHDAISLKDIGCPRASRPKLRLRVDIQERRPPQRGRPKRNGKHAITEWMQVSRASEEFRYHTLMVPTPDTWTIDTLRLVLHRMRRFLPAHDVADARAAIVLNGRRPILYVDAGGWRAVLDVHLHQSQLRAEDYLNPGAYEYAASEERRDLERPFSEPMLDTLRQLAARGPMRLACIEPPGGIVLLPSRKPASPAVNPDWQHTVVWPRIVRKLGWVGAKYDPRTLPTLLISIERAIDRVLKEFPRK